MIRRPLWNRGGGVFVEEASWNVPLERRPAADLPAPRQPPPAVRTAPPADRARDPRATHEAEPPAKRRRAVKPVAKPKPRRDGLRSGPTWLGVLTARDDD